MEKLFPYPYQHLKTRVMKKQLLFLFILSSFLNFAQKKTIKYKVEQLIPYCGGARPTPEIEKETQIPKPYAGKWFFYSPAKGKTDSVKTDDKGILTVNLSKGTYKFYEAWKYNKKTADGAPLNFFDKSCLETEWKKEDLLIVVSKGKEKVTNNISQAKCPWQYPCYLKEHLPRLPE